MLNTKSFIFSLYNNGSFSYSPTNKISNLYSTCFGVMCLDLIGELNNFQDKNKVIEYIQSYQDVETGYFWDETAIPPNNTTHNKEYILLQLTDFAQLALSALNKKARYKYIFLEKYKNKNYLEQWFYSLKWGNPWLASNLIMFILNSFIHEDETKNKEYIYIIVKLLNQSQDPISGYWNLGNKVTLHNQMAGAYHFILFYTYLGIKPSHIERIVDSTLAIQNHDGLFNYEGGGGSCDDLDAVDLLCRALLYSDYNISEIKISLQSTYCSLLKNQNLDGGFCWAKRNCLSTKDFIYLINMRMLRTKSDFIFNATSKAKRIGYNIIKKDFKWKYSGLKNMELRNDSSDLFSTWFRLTSIALIETTFPDIYQKSHKWNLRTNSGLGFYRR